MTLALDTRKLALPLILGLLPMAGVSAQGRKLSETLAYSYHGDSGEFVLGAGYLVYEALGHADSPYSILSVSLDDARTTKTLYTEGTADLLTATPDGTRVLFRVGQVNYGNAELYSVPVDGAETAIRLCPALTTGEDVLSFQVSPDGRWVVYEANVVRTDPSGTLRVYRRLFQAPVDGSLPVRELMPNDELPLGNTTYGITSDSARVVFLQKASSGGSYLVSAALDGTGDPLRLTPGSAGSFQLSPDGRGVLYLSSPFDPVTGQYLTNLYTVPADGSLAPLQLNPPLPAGGAVISSFRITPDSTCVAYGADQVGDGTFELYVVPLAGGTPVGIGPISRYSLQIAIAPDSRCLVYKGLDDHLFAAPLDGSRPTTALADFAVTEFAIAPDSSRVVFAGQQSVHSAPIDGSSPSVALVLPAADRSVRGIRILADSSRALFQVMQQVGPYYYQFYGQLHSAAIDGSESAVRLDASPPPQGGVSQLRGVTSHLIDAARNLAIYRADQVQVGFFELFEAPLDGSEPGRELSDLRDSLGVYGRISRYEVGPDGEHLHYTATLHGGFDSSSYPAHDFRVPLNGSPVSSPEYSGTLTPDSMRLYWTRIIDVYDPRIGLFGALAGELGPVAVLHPVPVAGSVVDPRSTPDSTRLVYRYDRSDAPGVALYSVPVDGSGLPVERTGWSGGEVNDFAISADSERIVFLGSPDGSRDELFSVRTSGGDLPVRLNSPLVPGGEVLAFSITPDGGRVVYLADQGRDDVQELFSVPIGGGTPLRLNGTLASGGDVTSFRLSADSRTVVYQADQEVDQRFDLYCVSIGPRDRPHYQASTLPSAPVRIVTLSGEQDRVVEFEITPDSRRVVFRGNLHGGLELFVVPLAGGSPPLRLNPPLVPMGKVRSFQVTADGSHAVYTADQDVRNTIEIYSVRLDGAFPLKLNPPLGTNRDVSTTTPFQLDPSGAWVLFNADVYTDGLDELFVAAIDGLAPTRRVNGPLQGDAPPPVTGTFTPRGIVYFAAEEIPDVGELYLDETSSRRHFARRGPP